nr:hypothetical protein [Deltaproteobacteria bacterium]
LVPRLIAQLVERCRVAQADPRVRHAALHLLGSVIGGADWAHRTRELVGPLRALADLPLVRDAAGVPRPIVWPWSGLVHTGSEPLDEDLAPWLSHVLWAPPGDPTAAFVGWPWVDRKALKDHIKRAKQERRARASFYKHAPREARVLGRRKPRVRARLGAPLAGSCIPDDAFEGLTGEVCLYRERRGGELTVLHEGREVETIEMDSALAFAVVIDSPHVKPTNRFRAVVRDAEYTRVERAMRAGLVRAIEAIGLAQTKTFVDGYHVAVEGSLADDEPVIRNGLLLARNLGAPLSPAFEHAQLWRTTDGYRSIAELRACGVLGAVPRHAAVTAPEGRLIVYTDEGERSLLADLVQARIVSYEPGALAERITGPELAIEIMGSTPHAITVADDQLVAAMLPSDKPELLLYHRGKKLAEFTYTPSLAPCRIAIDCDQIIPDESWSGIVDDAGLGTRDYGPWERLLAQEIVGAIIGERSPALLGGDRVDLTGTLGRWLCFSLYLPDPNVTLGSELFTRFKMCSMFRVLGEDRAFSLEELAVMFPETILFVDRVTEPVAGMPVVVADTVVARTVAKLAKRKYRFAMDDLVKRRTEIARDLRLGMHRALPTQPLEVAGTHVKIASSFGRGVVGVGRDAFELQILVESRPFQTITRHELPLSAVFELTDLGRIDDKFEQLKLEAVEQVLAAVRGKCPDLLRDIAREFPEAFADAGPRRALLAAFVAKHALPLDIRDTLARTIKFPTVQGLRATIIEARRGPAIQTCTWTGEWLVAEVGEDPLDQPVLLAAGSPELVAILGALGNIVDVTRDVEKLQAQRRIARGLLPTPRVTGADPELTKRISELGTAFKDLGPGEVALVAGEAEVLLHVNGELRERVALECMPAIQLAIEAADLVGDAEQVERRIGPEARRLAVLLVRRVLLA